MHHCRSCERKDRKIRAQAVLIASQKHDLAADEKRIKRLQEALCEVCDYAEVCQHFPAKSLLTAQ